MIHFVLFRQRREHQLYINKKTILLLAGIIVPVFSGVGVYAATTQISASTIYACQMKQVGLLRVVDANTSCTKNETKVSWNVAGPKGDPGVAGPAGSQGPAGTNGATGPQGPAGVKGDTGAVGPQGVQGSKGDKGDASKIIAGDVDATGNILNGNGFTVELDSNFYVVRFPAGTWTHKPIVTVSAYIDDKLTTPLIGTVLFNREGAGSAAFDLEMLDLHSLSSGDATRVANRFSFIAVDPQK
jgi:hypothetical protein